MKFFAKGYVNSKYKRTDGIVKLHFCHLSVLLKDWATINQTEWVSRKVFFNLDTTNHQL